MQSWLELREETYKDQLIFPLSSPLGTLSFCFTYLSRTEAEFVTLCGQLVISGEALPVGTERATELCRVAPQALLDAHEGCKDGAICASQAITAVTSIHLVLPHLQLLRTIKREHVTH